MASPYPPPGPQHPPPGHAPPPHQSGAPDARTVVQDVKSEVPRTISEIQRLPYSLMAIVVGGFCAIGLGVLFLILNIVEAATYTVYYSPFSGFAIICALVTFIMDLIFGIGLLYTYVTAKRGDWNKAMWMALVISFLLLILGSTGGKIGGVLGIIGGALIFFDPNLRDLGRSGHEAPPPSYPPPPGPAPPPYGGQAPPPGGYPPPGQAPPPPGGPPPPGH